jgi:hypothetical protein
MFLVLTFGLLVAREQSSKNSSRLRKWSKWLSLSKLRRKCLVGYGTVTVTWRLLRRMGLLRNLAQFAGGPEMAVILSTFRPQ